MTHALLGMIPLLEFTVSPFSGIPMVLTGVISLGVLRLLMISSQGKSKSNPFCDPWPNMSKTFWLDPKETVFGIISGGIRNMTPTSFLYRVNPNDLVDWEYFGPMANYGLNFRPSRRSGDFGKNWEVT
ncbi:hypothetical protein BDV27DRAFT_158962 [Aspergillus caelatus]|uniref:Glycosyl hydrolase n=1 Tax=Aspergillus caelatus TaxID=61420 RepID=A0A5N7A079_9EURO|nr:uncharacterized protein BDV27DRAFT_158962 [Aspergillus caelatus]KAE8363274.1 hypothetical protein BDV27DRAFT_158962 [Aspergillus caelatus]